MKNFYLYCFILIIFSMPIFPKDFWEKVNVPNDSPVRDISFDKNGDIYTCYNGIFRSTDKGNHWIEIDTLNYMGYSCKFSQIGYFLNSVILVKSGLILASGADGYMFRSKDNGINWEVLDKAPQNVHTFHVSSSGRIFANQLSDLFYSDDDGDNWTRFEGWEKTGNGSSHIVRMAESPDGKLFVAYNGVWIIDQSTLQYEHVTNGLDTSGIRCFEFGNGKVFAGTDTSGIFISNDNGISWKNLPGAPKYVPITALAITSSNKIIAGSERGGLFVSVDSGKTWAKPKDDISSNPIYDIEIDNNTIYLGSTGVYKSTDDGSTWVLLKNNPGFPIIINYDLDNDGIIFTKTLFYLYKSADKGNKWDIINNSYFKPDNSFDITLCNDNQLFAWSSYKNNYFINSTDKGKTWNNVFSDLTSKKIFKVTENSKGYLYSLLSDSLNGYLCCSKDNGKNWEKIHSMQSILFNICNNDELIGLYNDEIIVSKDFGVTWEKIPTQDIPVNDLYNARIILTNGNYMWLGSNSKEGIMRTSDNGGTWNVDNSGIIADFIPEKNIQVNDLKMINGNLYTATNIGLFSSYDNGDNWYPNDSGLVHSNSGIVKLLKNKHIYVSTSLGLFRTVDEIVSVEYSPITINDNISINIYPNPVSSTGKIEISSKSNSELKLCLYDLSGRLIRVLFDGNVYQQRLDLNFSSEGISAGKYFLRAESGNDSKTAMISIVK